MILSFLANVHIFRDSTTNWDGTKKIVQNGAGLGET